MKNSTAAARRLITACIPIAALLFFTFDSFAATQDRSGLLLNEFLASNRAGLRDDEGNRSDWVELRNSGSNDIQLSGFRLTDNLDKPNKWAFPDYQLSPGSHFLVWMSGRDENSLTASSLTSTEGTVEFDTTLIDAGAEWRFRHFRNAGDTAQSSEQIPPNWTAVDFDASAFEPGRAGFGYGDDDNKTELPTGTTVVLLRHEFDLENLPPSRSLVLQMDYDDGFIAYLNGERVASANAPREGITSQSVAAGSHDAGVPGLYDLSDRVDLLREGKNVLAIVGLNNSSQSSDLSLHPVMGALRPVCHANFKLDKDGGELFLIAPNGDVVDRINYPEQTSDVSLGRSVSGPNQWGYFIAPTPGESNIGYSSTQPLEPPSISPAPGGYEQSVEVILKAPRAAETEIRYTVDGTEPNGASPRYRKPIDLTKTTLVRAVVFSGGHRASRIESATYLVGSDRPQLPVLSISMKPQFFRDVQLNARATGHASERAAFMEYFEPDGTRSIATGFGLRLHGGAGRNGPFERKKSYRTYFRKSYGVGRVDGRIIPEAGVEDFDKLVLRSSSNDKATHGSSIRDQVVRDIHADMGALASRGSWCVLLVNGENRGVYNITERMDEEFYASHFGDGYYDVIKTGESVLNGSREGWDELRAFVEKNDFTDDAMFAELAARVDVKNLTSYMVVNMALTNFDWPNNNWYAARRIPDGKWTFQCWDAEWALGYEFPWLDDAPYGVEVDPYAFIDSGGGYGGALSRKIFLALLDNPAFREHYQNEVRRYLAGPLSPENVVRHIHRHRDAIAHDMEIEYRSHGQTLDRWYEQLKIVEHFGQSTPRYFQKWTDEYFSHQSTPDEEERLALYEDTAERRNIVYRDADGALRHVRSTTDGNNWSTQPNLTTGSAPTAAGTPIVYSSREKNRKIAYRGTDRHIHELSRLENSNGDAPWNHVNLTKQLKLPLASCDPSAVVVDGVPHIVYVDKNSRIHEIWFDEEWKHHPLPASPKPASDATITASPGALHVTYRTIFDVPCEQQLDLGSSTDDRRAWQHRLTQRIPIAGVPTGATIDGKWRIVFRPTEGWSLREPFIFTFNNATRVGYREYNGPRNGVMQAWDQRGRFQHLEQIGEPEIPIVGNPVTLTDSRGNVRHIVYRDVNGHIREATKESNGNWLLEDITDLAGAPPAASDPSGIVRTRSGERAYVFREQNGDLHEMRLNGKWTHHAINAPSRALNSN